ncbi:MAG TPA: hypothetical protein VFN36_00170 [Solirubrobacteraceae bacterium]|nr:hypothetical protein [Solirubrobacteraceae bacterium]
MTHRPTTAPSDAAAHPTAAHPTAAVDPARPRVWTRTTLALTIGVLILGLGFILSYVGAFHHPTPHRVDLAVVAPAGESSQIVSRLNALPGTPLHARTVGGGVAARRLVEQDRTTAAFLISSRGHRDRLLVAAGGGAALSAAVQSVVTTFDARQRRTVHSVDVAPLQTGDYHGLTGFYLVVGWLVAGYLLAAILGITLGPRAATVRDATSRLVAVAPYSIVAGIGGALIVDTLLRAQTGHFLAVAGVGALLVFAAASVTIALETLLGVAGIGLAILLYVVLGNPSAGGAYQDPLLPGFWRAIGNALPNGAGVDTIRRIVYFGSHGIAGHLILIGAYCLAATAVTLLATRHRSPARPRVSPTGVSSDPGPSGSWCPSRDRCGAAG